MAQQTLLGGNGVTGEDGATHNSKANSNFTELYAATAAAQADADAAESAISTHISANPAHIAANIAFTPVGSIGATNIQDAIAEVAVEAGATVPDATTSVKGISEFLTDAEFNTGTDTTRSSTASNVTASFKEFTTLTDAAPVVFDCTNAREPKGYLETSSSRTFDLQNVRGTSVNGAYSYITKIIKKTTASDVVITLDSGFTNKDISTDSAVTGYTLSGATDKYFKITGLVMGQGSGAIIWWNLVVQSSLVIQVPVLAGGTLTLDCANQEDTLHEYLVDITSNTTIAFSNAGNARIIHLAMYVFGSNLEFTMPSSVVVSEVDTRFNNTTKKLTISGTSTVKLYELAFLKIGSVYSLRPDYAKPIA